MRSPSDERRDDADTADALAHQRELEQQQQEGADDERN